MDEDACASSQAFQNVLHNAPSQPRHERIENTSHEHERKADSELNKGEEGSSLAIHSKPYREDRLKERQHSVEDASASCLDRVGQTSSQSKGYNTAIRVSNERGNIPDSNEEPVPEDERLAQLTPSWAKRSRRASSRSPFPPKKTKIGHNPSLEDLELDRDTIVVEGRSVTRTTPATNANAPFPQSQSKSRTEESRLPRQYSGESPRVVFSSTTEIDTKNAMAFLRECGGKEVKNISAAIMLCVGSNKPLKKTANLRLAVCVGLDVVTDQWLVGSQRKGFLLHSDQYLPKDSECEREWGFKLHEAIARGKLQGGLSSLLNGLDVYFTHGLKSLLAHNFRDFGTVATCLGADAVKNGLRNGKGRKAFLILGTADDPQTLNASRMGHEVLWSKDLLVTDALRGTIQRVDEFNIAKAHEARKRHVRRSCTMMRCLRRTTELAYMPYAYHMFVVFFVEVWTIVWDVEDYIFESSLRFHVVSMRPLTIAMFVLHVRIIRSTEQSHMWNICPSRCHCQPGW